MKRPLAERVLVPAPIAKPGDFVVVEREVLALPATDVPGDGSPYRTAPPQPPVRARPTLTITWRQQRGPVGDVALFLFVWNAISISLLVGGAIAGVPIVLITGCLFTTVGMWFGLAITLNKVQLEAGRDALVLRSGPVPPGRSHLRLPVADLRQLYVVEHQDDSTTRGRRYVLYARDRGGRDHELATFDDADTAWWLEERLEHHLGIVDRPVSELEHRRPMQLAPGPTDE